MLEQYLPFVGLIVYGNIDIDNTSSIEKIILFEDGIELVRRKNQKVRRLPYMLHQRWLLRQLW